MNNFLQILSRCSRFVMISPILLSILGIFSLMSLASGQGTFPSREVFIQSAALIVGLAFAAAVMNLGYRYFIGLEKYLYPAGILLLISVYIPGLGISSYGSRSWISFGMLTFQPSEIAKLIFILILASYLSRKKEQLSTPCGIVKAALFALPYILIVAKEDLGSGCVFCVIWIFMVFCSGLELKQLGRAFLILCGFLPIIYSLLAGYQKNRIDAFLHPDDFSLPGNYQVWNAKTAIGSGGFSGKGYLHGTQSSLGFLPVPESDFIFAAIVEELGFLGGLLIILLFAFFLYHTWKTAKYASDLQGTLLASGIGAMFSFQAFENIAMNLGIMPVTGITLPFLSYGGSSMLASMISCGFLLSVSARQKL